MVTLLNVFFGDHPETSPSGALSVDEIAAAVATARGRAATVAGVMAPPSAT
jgi:hypothetical protein